MRVNIQSLPAFELKKIVRLTREGHSVAFMRGNTRRRGNGRET